MSHIYAIWYRRGGDGRLPYFDRSLASTPSPARGASQQLSFIYSSNRIFVYVYQTKICNYSCLHGQARRACPLRSWTASVSPSLCRCCGEVGLHRPGERIAAGRCPLLGSPSQTIAHRLARRASGTPNRWPAAGSRAARAVRGDRLLGGQRTRTLRPRGHRRRVSASSIRDRAATRRLNFDRFRNRL